MTGICKVGHILTGFALFALLVSCRTVPAAAECDLRPLDAGEPGTNQATAVISIWTSAGKAVPFTPAGTPQLEIVNDRLNLAVSSREGMIFELTGIAAKNSIAARRYRGAEFRALLLHSGFQEEAASDDQFEKTSMLEIRERASETGGKLTEFHYRGKLRAGAETLDVRFQYSGSLPANRKSLTPNPQPPQGSNEIIN